MFLDPPPYPGAGSATGLTTNTVSSNPTAKFFVAGHFTLSFKKAVHANMTNFVVKNWTVCMLRRGADI